MSISTKRGDAGQTGLAGGIRVSKSDLRVESYGTVDELNTVLGFARSICKNEEIVEWTHQIQRTLFRLGSAIATPPESKKTPPVISPEDVEMLSGSCLGSKRQRASWPTGPSQARIPNPLRMKWRALYAAVRNGLSCGLSKRQVLSFSRRSFPISIASPT